MQLAKELLKSELEHFNQYLSDCLQGDIPLHQDIINHILQNKGKQMRPMFSLLCARLGGEINEKSYRAALVVEILHTSSLVHDDIIDNSMERRGVLSVNGIWKNRAAVFTGDILSFDALLLTLKNNDFRMLELYSKSIGQIIEGEILQLRKSRRMNFDENVYYDIIRAKTAAFFAGACAAGASTTFDDQDDIEKFRQFGEKVGLAFQIKDDLFEYNNDNIGKPKSSDILDKKLTLPLIFTLKNCDKNLKKKLTRILKNKSKSVDDIHYIVENVIKAGGVRYAENIMMSFRDQALEILNNYESSPARSALEDLVRFVTDRKY